MGAATFSRFLTHCQNAEQIFIAQNDFKGLSLSLIIVMMLLAGIAADLPYKVDLVNYNSCDEEFKKIIDKNCIRLELKPK